MSQKSKYSSQHVELCDAKPPTRRDRQRFTKPSTPRICMHGSKERNIEKSDQSNQYLLKNTALNKQQNVLSDNSNTPPKVVQYCASDDSALVEVTVKTTKAPKQRSKSTVSDREPWGQMLKKNKNITKESVFSNFDPLRTLHFLAKELQIHLEALLPDEINVQEIIKNMQSALKRVPPEVASLVHLQQSIGLLPGLRHSVSERTIDDISEKQFLLTEHKGIQTVALHDPENVNKVRKLMEESTFKLEESCRHLETLCTQLKNEKIYLEGQVQCERAHSEFLKKRVEDLENLNKDLKHTLYEKDEQISQLKSNIDLLETKVKDTHSTKSEIKSLVGDLKKSKSNLEQECVKLKHQLRLSTIEKEKYLAVLGVRDRQMQEIRNEMSQLQEVVNDQLVELHNNALASMPSNGSFVAFMAKKNKENVENDSISTIHINDDDAYETDNKLSDKSLPPGDEVVQLDSQNVYIQDNIKHFVSRDFRQIPDGASESQTTARIREMFSELKNQAYALTGNDADVQ